MRQAGQSISHIAKVLGVVGKSSVSRAMAKVEEETAVSALR